jgi:hypothetical protein
MLFAFLIFCNRIAVVFLILSISFSITDLAKNVIFDQRGSFFTTPASDRAKLLACHS